MEETRTPQKAYEYAIRRKKGIEHSRTMKSNLVGSILSVTIKQETMGYIQPRGGRADFRQTFRTTIEENVCVEDRTNDEKIKTVFHRTNSQKQCYKCGKIFGLNHLQNWKARDKFARHVQNGDILQKPVAQIMYFSFKIIMKTNRETIMRINLLNQKITTQLLNSRHKTDGRNYKETSSPFWLAHADASEIKQTAKINEEDLKGHIVILKTKTRGFGERNVISEWNNSTITRKQQFLHA